MRAKAPLADQGELSRASPASTRLRGSELPSFRAFSTVAPLQSLSQKSKIFASSLYTREPLGAPAPVRLSIFLRRINVLYHIHTTFFLCAMTWCFDSLRASARPGRRSDSYFGFFSMASQLARPVRLTRASISSASISVSWPGVSRHRQLKPTVPGWFIRASLPRPR